MAADALVDIGPRPVPQEPMVRDLNPLTHSPSHINPKIPPLPPIPLNIAFIPLSLTHTQYIIANLGFSINFGGIDFENIVLPTTMSVDYIRVYQRRDAINIGCDPISFPTRTYIET